MPAVPKRKTSKGRGRRRHSQWKLKAPRLVTCSQCGAPVQPHHICMSCGTYRGVQVIELEEE
jgi:large subunit ribosomal protein L32